ncbi:reverse transcriptase RNA-dependent DNA polymerase [Nitzschia inconspicua]|uniref:Reverse transcriptase RNA-dependent DNA polymerase n=1 Tax=Nitzschia inconspicua TaxID=303405 RepID=A0A9K3L155_9STRA|nr:reverse transcriptase RNA-dependent DNA polymerase [Nitzschia inconspicua]
MATITAATDEMSSFKTYLFDGSDSSKFREWKIKSRAYAQRKKFWKGFTTDIYDTEVKDSNGNVVKAKSSDDDITAKQTAMHYLIESLSGSAFTVVTTQTEDDPKLAWDLLIRHYEETGEEDYETVMRDLQSLTMGKTEKPSEFRDRLTLINERLRRINNTYVLNETQFKMQFLSKLTDDYEILRQHFQTTYGGKITVDTMAKDLDNRYKALHGEGKKDGTSTVMNTEVQQTKDKSGSKPKKQYKKNCKYCGKLGHMQKDCRGLKKDKQESEKTGEKVLTNAICYNCKGHGHLSSNCPKKNKSNENESLFTAVFCTETIEESVFNVDVEADEDGYESYLVDSGASLSTGTHNEKMTNRQPSTLRVKVGNGNIMDATETGNVGLQQKGTNATLALQLTVVPGMAKSVISVPRMQQAGWTVVLTPNAAYAEKDGQRINFTKKRDGMWYFIGKRFQVPSQRAVFEVSTEQWTDTTPEPEEQRMPYGKAMPTTMDYNDAHVRWGHKGKTLLDKTGKFYGIKLTGELKPCEGCGLALAKQKAVCKVSLSAAKTPGFRLFLDATGPFEETVGGSKYAFSIVDDFTRKGWIKTAARKSQMTEFAKDVLKELKSLEYSTKFVRCDNAGENATPLKKVCNDFGAQMELTAPYTPQMNGVVERRLPILVTRANAAMMTAGLNDEAKARLWGEAMNYQNDTENMTLSSVRDTPGDAVLYKDTAKLIKYAQPFGRIGIVTIRRQFGSKWKAKGIKCIFVGYAKDHPADTYRMYNPATRSIVQSRDVKFLEFTTPNPKEGMSVFDIDPEIKALPIGLDDTPPPAVVNDKQPHLIPNDADEFDDVLRSNASSGRNVAPTTFNEDDNETTEQVVQDNSNEDQNGSAEVRREEQGGEEERSREEQVRIVNAQRKAAKLERELRRLDTSYNPLSRTSNELIQVQAPNDGTKEVNLHFMFAAAETLIGEPQTTKEAFNGPEAKEWKESYICEFKNFVQRNVWKKVKKEVPKRLQRKIMKSKVVFKKKIEHDNSIRYKTRFVSKGFLMETGIDYQESFSPVGNESSTRVVIGIYLFNADNKDEDMRFYIEVIDIDAAFLEGENEIRLFMEFPDGMEDVGLINADERKTHCVELLKSMYGNVDAALIFFKTYKKHLTEKMNMEQSVVDPCVFYKRDEKGRTILVAITHVDDTLLTGTRKAIDEFKAGVKKRFGFTGQDGFVKHLGVWYKQKRDENGELYMEADMHDTVEKIIKTYKNLKGSIPKSYNTPGTPGLSMDRNEKGKPSVNERNFRKIVGQVMYLTHKLMMEGSNAARELARNFGNPNEIHWKELERFIGFLNANIKD